MEKSRKIVKGSIKKYPEMTVSNRKPIKKDFNNNTNDSPCGRFCNRPHSFNKSKTLKAVKNSNPDR